MQDGDARHAIPTDDAHLDPAAIRGTRDNRNDGVLWKDDVPNRLVWLNDYVASLQLDHFKVGLNGGQIVRRERQQQGVVDNGRLGVTDDGQMRRLRHGFPAVLGAGVRVSLSRLRPGSIGKQQRNYGHESRKKQRTTSLFLCAFPENSLALYFQLGFSMHLL